MQAPYTHTSQLHFNRKSIIRNQQHDIFSWDAMIWYGYTLYDILNCNTLCSVKYDVRSYILTRWQCIAKVKFQESSEWHFYRHTQGLCGTTFYGDTFLCTFEFWTPSNTILKLFWFSTEKKKRRRLKCKANAILRRCIRFTMKHPFITK